jgi:Outer membrane protein beta-barrel domain
MRRVSSAVVTLVVLLLAVPALGFAQSMPTITRNGGPATNVNVFMYLNGAKQPMPTFDPAMLTNKIRPGTRVDVYRRECQDGKIELVLVPAGEQLGPDDQDCDKKNQAPAGADCRCDKIGAFIWGDPVTIDAGTGQITGSSIGGGGTSGIGRTIDVLIDAGLKHATFGDAADKACAYINDLYAQAQYDSHTCSGTGANGFYAGAGVRIPLVNRVSFEVGALYEKFGDLQVTTSGTRADLNLRYDETSKTKFKVFGLEAGPSFSISSRVRIAPLVQILRWTADESDQASLLEGTPQTLVKSDSATDSASGTNLGLAVRATIALGSNAAIVAQYDRATFSTVFPNGSTTGFPVDVTVSELKLGMVLALAWAR